MLFCLCFKTLLGLLLSSCARLIVKTYETTFSHKVEACVNLKCLIRFVLVILDSFSKPTVKHTISPPLQLLTAIVNVN